MRRYFATQGQPHTLTCDLPTLLSVSKSKIKFTERGRQIEPIFMEALVVHHTGGSVGDAYWDQLTDRTLLKSTQYGDFPAIRRVAHERVLVFLNEAIVALKAQTDYLRAEMLQRSEWTHP